MTDQEKPEAEDLDEQNGELLPERTAMSIITPPADGSEFGDWPDKIAPPDPPQT
jgi:hypothetical protein